MKVSYYDNLFVISWHSGFPLERQLVISNSLSMSNIQQLKTKNEKIYKLKPKEQHIPYQVPIINPSNYDMGSSCLKYGLHHSSIDKNRFIKRNLGVEFESLVTNVD